MAAPQWVGQLAKWGFFANGIAHLLVGVLAVMGLAGILRYLSQQLCGRWMVRIAASGLLAYGGFVLFKVPNRRVSPRLAQTEEET